MGPKAVTIWKMEQASNFTKIFHCRESSVARLKQEVVLNTVVKFHVGKSPFHSTTSDLNTVRGQPLLAFFFFFLWGKSGRQADLIPKNHCWSELLHSSQAQY